MRLFKTIYSTKEWKGHGKQNYSHNEYRTDGEEVVKYHCNRQRYFDGEESSWHESEKKVDSWNMDDPNMPDWLNKYV